MIEGFYGVGGERYVVGEGDCLALGHHRLRFSLIPMVHWPETVSYTHLDVYKRQG